MRAIVFHKPGPSAELQLAEVAAPRVGPHDVRIAVHAAAVNPVDIQTRSGMYHDLGWISADSETGIGWDASGHIAEIGDKVAATRPELTVGARVAVMDAGVDKRLGAYATELVVPSAGVALIPEDLDLTHAATVPLNGLTAAQAIELLGDVKRGRLLVTGAAGAVGGFAVTLASRRGWQVTTLARAADDAFVRAAGAHAVLHELPGDARFDAVLDAADIGDAAMATIVDGGRYVGVIPPRLPASVRDIMVDADMVEQDAPQLGELLQLAASGSLTTRVARTLPLEAASQAHAQLADGGVRGRIVLLP